MYVHFLKMVSVQPYGKTLTGCKGPGSGLPYLIVSGVWRNFQILHICVTFDKFSALNPGWFINRWDVRGEDACERPAESAGASPTNARAACGGTPGPHEPAFGQALMALGCSVVVVQGPRGDVGRSAGCCLELCGAECV